MTELPEVLDLSAEPNVPAAAEKAERHRPWPRLLAWGVAVTLVGGLVGVADLRARQARERQQAIAVELTVSGAAVAAPAASGLVAPPGVIDAGVLLQVRASAPVVATSAQLDGGPPRTGTATRAASRSLVFPVRWRVLCAEVGTVPGPRLIDLTVSTVAGAVTRRVRLPTDDAAPIGRTFRIAAATACAAAGPHP